jgi:predicted nicotinamide N-methyase
VLLAGDVFSTGGDPYWFLPWVKKGRWILIGEPPERGFPKEYLKKLENYSVRTFPDFEHPEIKEASVYTLLKGMEWREGKEEQIKLGTGFADGIAKGQIILDNTEVASTPLVPEIRVRLLRPDSPLWQSFGDGPDSVRSPRPYWAFAWSGGQGLARYVLDYPEVVKAKRILDFGAGCGIASIAAAKAGAARVVASDIDPISIAVIGYNARLNNVEVETLCADLIYAKNRGWDVILAGDIWYDSRVSRHGLYWLRKLAGEGVMVLTADPGRKYSPSQGLEALADYPCRSLPDLEHPNLQRVFVSRVVAQSSHF